MKQQQSNTDLREASVHFMTDISQYNRPRNNLISIGDKKIVYYASKEINHVTRVKEKILSVFPQANHFPDHHRADIGRFFYPECLICHHGFHRSCAVDRKSVV